LAIRARHAQHSARIGEANALAAQAVATLDTDPAAGLQSALQAAETSPTRQAEGALHAALAADRAIVTFGGVPPGPDHVPTFSPDGKLMLTQGGDDAKARLWNIATGRLVFSLGFRGRRANAILSPDGRLLLTGQESRWAPSPETVQPWDTATGGLVRTLP